MWLCLFYLRYQLSDGQEREEKGELQKTKTSSFYRVKGSYSFIGADDVVHRVEYTADENGFVPKISSESESDSESIEFDDRIDLQIVKTLVG